MKTTSTENLWTETSHGLQLGWNKEWMIPTSRGFAQIPHQELSHSSVHLSWSQTEAFQGKRTFLVPGSYAGPCEYAVRRMGRLAGPADRWWAPGPSTMEQPALRTLTSTPILGVRAHTPWLQTHLHLKLLLGGKKSQDPKHKFASTSQH